MDKGGNSCDLAGAIALGRQITVEFYDCSAEILANVRRMEEIFLEAARESGAHVVNSNFHSFEPQGVSGVVVISESHFAVHAWPEHDYAAVDLFTCGSGVDFDIAVETLAHLMHSGHWIISSLVNRGIIRESGQLERLVPVIENSRCSGLQLSWKERFNDSLASALSAAIDIYDCGNRDGDNEQHLKDFCEKLTSRIVADSDSAVGKWVFSSGSNEFIHFLPGGKISGYISSEGGKNNLYLDIFVHGFFDPRSAAEFAMDFFSGTYYRMQVQVRQ